MRHMLSTFKEICSTTDSPAVDASVESPGRGCRGEDGCGHQVEADRGEAGGVGRLDRGCVDGREAETGVEFVTADGLWQ